MGLLWSWSLVEDAGAWHGDDGVMELSIPLQALLQLLELLESTHRWAPPGERTASGFAVAYLPLTVE
eukprot:m.124332 g.124332  ORF g.124332 m.124332 type:complete len:67 (-) comp15592_c0_seq1:382-582(-)